MKQLSRYDLERICGDAIQLHFDTWDGCEAYISERMSEKRGIHKSELTDTELEVAAGIRLAVEKFNHAAKMLYDPKYTLESPPAF